MKIVKNCAEGSKANKLTADEIVEKLEPGTVFKFCDFVFMKIKGTGRQAIYLNTHNGLITSPISSWGSDPNAIIVLPNAYLMTGE